MLNASLGAAEQLAYEPFGKRRNSNGVTDTAGTLVASTNDRGYTGHEMLDELSLIHMSGRVYDPAIGRFLSADPHITDPTNAQSYNRYSYVWNNPLRFTDPTGLTVEGGNGDTGGEAGDANYTDKTSGISWGKSSSSKPAVTTSANGQTNAKASEGFGSRDGEHATNTDDDQTPGQRVLARQRALGRDVAVAGEAVTKEAGSWFLGGMVGKALGPMINAGKWIGRALGLGAKEAGAVAEGTGIVAKDGTAIVGFTKHGVDRAIGDGAKRAGTKPEAILDAVKNPTKTKEGVDVLGRPFKIYTGENARVVINPDTGRIVSTNPLSRGGAHQP